MPRLTRAAVALALALAVPALPALTPVAQAADPLTVVDQVGLIQPQRDGGKPVLNIRSSDYDGGNERDVAPARALLHLPSSARTTVPHDDFARDEVGNPSEDPADSYYRFLGAEGTPVFTTAVDPASGRQDGNLVLGNTGSATLAAGTYGETRLQKVTGPGPVHLYNDTPVVDDPEAEPYRALLWDLSRPAGVDNVYGDAYEPTDRLYAFGAFAATGEYCVQVRPEITARDGSKPETGDPVAIRVVVGDRSESELAATPACEQPGPETPQQPTDPDAPVVVGAGAHVDVAGVLRNGGPLGLVLRKTDAAGGGNEKLLPFADTVVSLPDAGRRTVPTNAVAGGDTSFLGRPGDPTWRIPEARNPNLVWLGFGGELIDDAVTSAPNLRVTGVTGADGGAPPGEVAVWSSRNFSAGTGPTFGSRQGLPRGAYLPVGSHGHRNWDFSAPGVYCLGMDLQVANGNGAELRDAQVLTVVVGDTVDPASVTPCGRSGRPLPLAVPSRPASPAPAGATAELTSTPDGNVPGTGNRLTTGLVGGQLRTTLVRDRLDRAGTAFDPDDVVLRARQDVVANESSAAGPVGRRLFSFTTVGGEGGGGDVLNIDTLGVQAADLSARLDWRITGVRGPGGVVVHDNFVDRTVLAASQAAPTARTSLVPGRMEQRFRLSLDTAGVYCVDMAWSGIRASDGATLRDSTTLTLVAGDQRNVTTCSRGQRATAPGGTGSTPPAPTDPGAGGGRPDSGRTVLRVGHLDVRATVSTSGVAVRVHDDHAQPAVDRDPNKVTFYTAPQARTTIPAAANYRFLGAAGAPVWVLPQTQDDRLLWPGWDTVLGAGATSVRWTLNSAKGPGSFALFENGAFGAPQVLLDSDRPGSHFDFAAHGHGNWAFGGDGVYCLNSTFTAQPAGRSTTASLLFAVGDLNPAKVTPADCGRTAAQLRAATGSGSGNGAGTGTGTAPTRNDPSPIATAVGTRPGTASSREQCLATPVRSTRPAAASVVSDGHFDLGSRLRSGSLRAEVEDGRSEPATSRDPSGLVFDVGAKAKQRVPAGYSFLGATGSPVWVIPQTQVAGIPWLGWNTQDPGLRSGAAGPVTFALRDVSGPGRVAVYTDGVFGGIDTKVFGTAPGFPRAFRVPLNVHAHANWAFTEPGTYRLTMTQTAPLVGGASRSATTTLTLAVGTNNPAASIPTVASVDYVGRTASGDACRLSSDARARALASTGATPADALITGALLIGAALVLLVAGRRRRRAV